MENKATVWLKGGIEAFVETGLLEVNSLCKKVGKSKSSFYNIWPNYVDSRGYDRYIEDLIEHHERVIQAHYKSLRKAFLINDYPEIIEVIIELGPGRFVYQQFSAQLRILKNKSPILEKYCEKNLKKAIEIIHEFWKVYNFEESEIMDDQELRLILDALMHLTYEEWLQDLRIIMGKRNKLRNP